MTKEEKNHKQTLDAMKKSSDDSFKQSARFKALEMASSKYMPSMGADQLTKEAEKIYQWLIKVLK